MMTDEQKSKVAELKAAIAATWADEGGRPAGGSSGGDGAEAGAASDGHDGARARRRRSGFTRARCVGGSRDVRPWTAVTAAPAKRGRAVGARSFRMVKVAASVATATRVASTSSGDHAGACGSRTRRAGSSIDGLDVESLAALLRRMS